MDRVYYRSLRQLFYFELLLALVKHFALPPSPPSRIRVILYNNIRHVVRYVVERRVVSLTRDTRFNKREFPLRPR